MRNTLWSWIQLLTPKLGRKYAKADAKDYEIIFDEIIKAVRFLLMHGNLHKRVHTVAYNQHKNTWDGILISLDSSLLLSLNKILEKDKHFGLSFESPQQKDFIKKIRTLRNKFIAHLDLQASKSKAKIVDKNMVTPSDIIDMIQALKERSIKYKTEYGLSINVEGRFTQVVQETMTDLDSWLKSFRDPL